MLRVWFATTACTAVPLALASGQPLPFPNWALWVTGLSVLSLVSLFAASGTQQNARALARALAARASSSDADEPRVMRTSPWHVPGARALAGAGALFLALAALYGSVAFELLRGALWQTLPIWTTAIPAVALSVAATALGRRRERDTPNAAVERIAPTLRVPVSDAARSGTAASEQTFDHSGRTPSMVGTPAGLASRAPGKPATARPSFDVDDVLPTPPKATPAVSPTAVSPTAASPARAVTPKTATRPASLGEAIGALFPDGAALIPALVTPVAPRSNSKRELATPTGQHLEARLGRHSGVQELKKQALTDPRRTRREADRTLGVEVRAPASNPSATEEQERDTERPPSRQTDRAATPEFREADIPTTPAPAQAEGDLPIPRAEGDEYLVRIPRSPKAPTFDAALLGDAPRSPERREPGPENFRPTQPATPSAGHSELRAATDEALERPTRPAASAAVAEAEARGVSADERKPEDVLVEPAEDASVAGDREAAAKSSDAAADSEPERLPDDLSLEQRPAELDRPFTETLSLDAAPFDSSLPPTPVDSEIRWVDVSNPHQPGSKEHEPLSKAAGDDASESEQDPWTSDSRQRARS